MVDQMPMLDMGMKDAEFMTAREKEKVLKQWETFLKNGCRRDLFTKPLYHHLTRHCSFIAHYDIQGFYLTYFENGDDAIRFLSQFDRSKGCRSVEYGWDDWLQGGNDAISQYYDINHAMVDIADKFRPELINKFRAKQKDKDLAAARRLRQKHGLKPEF